MRLKRLDYLFFLLVLVVLFVIANVVAYHSIKNQSGGLSMFDKEKYRPYKDQFFLVENQSQIPHPFYGLSSVGWEKFPNEITNEPLFWAITPSEVQNPIKVLVVGGSVASHLSKGGTGVRNHLFSELLNKKFKSNRFVVYNAAFPGGKQPQQYFRYLYLELVGFKPDIVVNLDGFNEIALPLAENSILGNPAIFPRSYSRQMHATAADRSCVKTSNFLTKNFFALPIAEWIGAIYVQKCFLSIVGTPHDIPWWSSGMGYKSSEQIKQSVLIWEQSSKNLNQKLTTLGIDYIHALQPNQYVENSKIYSDEEKSNFIDYKFYSDPIKQNYLKLSGRNLNVKYFIDQRFLFEKNSQTMYADNCCHFNELGMESIINDIIEKAKPAFLRKLN